MATKPDVRAIKDNLVRLFTTTDDDIPETPMVIPRVSTENVVQVARAQTAVDLTGQHKLVMAFGPGRSGKTTLLRWIAERAIQGERPLSLATADAGRPTLRRFFPDTDGPDVPEQAQAWLERMFTALMRQQTTVAIDFSADMNLSSLLRHAPNLHETLEGVGVAPVALYMLTTRSSDLTVLHAMEEAGFKPQATALVLNLGTIDEGRDPTAEFAQLRRNSVYRSAVARGAVEIWMPRFYAARQVEDRGMSFSTARMPSSGISIFDQSRTVHWLEAMETAFGPILTWLP